MESKPTTANAVWIALATLHKENPDKDAFQAKDIFTKIKELDIQNVSNGTIHTHISSHCVANKPAQPDTHRKITRIRQGWYRLFVDGEAYDATRDNGHTVPLPEMIPKKFHYLIDWYYDDYVKQNHINVESTETHSTSNMSEDVEHYHKSVEFASVHNNAVQIPDKIIKKLNIKSGDHIAFIQDGDKLILKKAKVRLEV